MLARKTLKSYFYIDIFLIILIVLVMFLFNYTHYVISYNLGLNNKLVMTFESLLYLTLFCLIFILVLIIIFILRLRVQFKNYGTKVIFIRILLFSLSLFVIILGEIVIMKPGYIYTCKGFSERMHREADIPAIQDWLETIDADSLDFKYDFVMLSKDEQPDSIAKLSPKNVYIEKYDTSKIRIRLEWGGTLVGRWGLIAGNNAMTMLIPDAKGDDEYIQQFAPGAYIWIKSR